MTLDTSALKHMESIRTALASVDHDLRVTTVSSRESPLMVERFGLDGPIAEGMVWGESKWGEGVWFGKRPMVAETFVLDESALGVGVLASDNDADLFEAIRLIIDNGFPRPGKRDQLSTGHRNQLRDAMILAAHVRDGRHLFVTGDEAAFIRDGRRERHEALCGTRIVLPTEIAGALDSMFPPGEPPDAT